MSVYKVGVWYDFRGDPQNNFQDNIAAKFSRVSGGNGRSEFFHFTEYIRGTNHKYYEGNWYTPQEIKEIPMSEIAQYLPYEVEIELTYEIY